MNREIKFRCWFADKMWYRIPAILFKKQYIQVNLNHKDDDFDQTADTWTGPDDYVLMQYTGFQDKNNRDVYEGDIFRIEENDEENTVIYIVVVWVKEWAMFTTLRLEDEYLAYLLEGVDAIDETMFWTYTLEDIGSPKHYPCGNIYENPELVGGSK